MHTRAWGNVQRVLRCYRREGGVSGTFLDPRNETERGVPKSVRGVRFLGEILVTLCNHSVHRGGHRFDSNVAIQFRHADPIAIYLLPWQSRINRTSLPFSSQCGPAIYPLRRDCII